MEQFKYVFREEVFLCDIEDSSVAISSARDIHDSLCKSVRHVSLNYILGRNTPPGKQNPMLRGFWEQLLGGKDEHVQAESLKLHSVTSVITCRAGLALLKVTLSDEASWKQSASLSIGNDGSVTGFGE